MTTRKTKTKSKNRNAVALTGNPFVDTGLATIAALSSCKTIDDLTLRKMKNVHGDGTKLAHTNSRLRSTFKIFPDSLLTNPSFKDKKKAKKNYAKITTALLNNIGDEQIDEMCEICGNTSSLDLDKVYRDTIKETNEKKNKKTKIGESNGDNDYKRRYIGRDWFPLTGSISSDAQVLPSGSRALNICATCLFAVQYLPQAVLVMKGKLLTLFQSTSTSFWYKLVRIGIVNTMSARLAVKKATSIEPLGSEDGIVTAVNKMMDVMRTLKLEPGTSLIVWMFSNAGSAAHCEIDEIPNFALKFLYEARQLGLRNEINDLMQKERRKHTSYSYSLLNSINERRDYLPQYPSKRFSNDGVSPELFFLYQTRIRNCPVKSLHTAYNIAQYVIDSKLDPENRKYKNFGTDIGKDAKAVKWWIIDMAKKGRITFDEYYDLFFSTMDRYSWNLIKYYLLKPETVNFRREETNNQQQQNQEHKNAIIDIGRRILKSYVERKGEERFRKEVLGGFAANKIGENWLRKQFERLVDEAEEAGKKFDFVDSWNLCLNKQGRELSIYDVLYLFRLFFTICFYFPAAYS
jgi:hypothetical protein